MRLDEVRGGDGEEPCLCLFSRLIVLLLPVLLPPLPPSSVSIISSSHALNSSCEASGALPLVAAAVAATTAAGLVVPTKLCSLRLPAGCSEVGVAAAESVPLRPTSWALRSLTNLGIAGGVGVPLTSRKRGAGVTALGPPPPPAVPLLVEGAACPSTLSGD